MMRPTASAATKTGLTMTATASRARNTGNSTTTHSTLAATTAQHRQLQALSSCSWSVTCNGQGTFSQNVVLKCRFLKYHANISQFLKADLQYIGYSLCHPHCNLIFYRGSLLGPHYTPYRETQTIVVSRSYAIHGLKL